jgi:hypothetical protein
MTSRTTDAGRHPAAISLYSNNPASRIQVGGDQMASLHTFRRNGFEQIRVTRFSITA